MASSSHTPDEPLSTIIQEESWFYGTLLSNFFFGVQSALTILACLDILKRRNPNNSRVRIAFLVFITVLYAVTTVSQGLSLDWIQMGFITQRNYPGGPSAFFSDEYSNPVNVSATILVVCANWMMESLMVWRCKVACSVGEDPWWFGIVIPLFLLVAVFATGSLVIHNIVHSAPIPAYALAYGISSLALNLTTTGFIAFRLLVYRRQIVRRLGHGHGKHYMSLVAVVVESAALYSSFLVFLIVAYAIGSPATNLLQQLVAPVQATTSLLVIIRLAREQEGSAPVHSQNTSAVASSWDTCVVPLSAKTQLGVLSTPLEATPRRKEEEARVSFLHPVAM